MTESKPSKWKEDFLNYSQKWKNRIIENAGDMYHFLRSYAHEVDFIPNSCNDLCLKSAKKFAGTKHELVWEAREFCNMGCEFPNLSTVSDCYRSCHVACREGHGEEVGLAKNVAENVSKYNGDPRVTRTCLDLCTQGCGFRKPSLEKD